MTRCATRPASATARRARSGRLLPEGTGAQDLAVNLRRGARPGPRDRIAETEAYQTSRRQRKKVEMLFAHLKPILKLDRLRLRGPNGARDEFHLAATAQNLRKLATLVPSSPADTGLRDSHQLRSRLLGCPARIIQKLTFSTVSGKSGSRGKG